MDDLARASTVDLPQGPVRSALCDQMLTGPQVWTRDDIAPEDITVPLDDACKAELLAFARHWSANPLPIIVLRPEDYALTACAAAARRAREILFAGRRFCVIDRLPLDELSDEEAKACYWLFSSMVCRPVAQKLDGTLIYDVLDTGQTAAAGSGIRPDKTNIELAFHNDNSYNRLMPEVVGLLCVRPAVAGGLSRAMSFDTAHNELLKRFPDALPRLYEPFWFDRQREHWPEDETTFAAPIFEYDDELRARFGLHQVLNGYAMRGEPIDDTTQSALDAVKEVFADPDLQYHFMMERGQIQYANNRSIGHSRTAFVDHEDPDKRRHLVRMWLRDHGLRSYTG